MRPIWIYIIVFGFLCNNVYGQEIPDTPTELELVLISIEDSGIDPDAKTFQLLEQTYLETKAEDQIDLQIRAASILSEGYKSRKDFKAASRYFSQFLELKDKQIELNREKMKDEFEKEFNPHKQEAEIELLESRNEIELLNLSRKKIILYSTLGGIPLLLLILLLIFRRYRIKQSVENQLEIQNRNFSESNEKLRRINEDMEESEKSLRSLNETKDRFFLLISEELRSPLFSLSNLLAQLIKEGHNFSKEEINSFAIKINDSVNSLLELIENLLQWSRIQMDTIVYKEEIIDLNAIVEENTNLLKSQADSRSIGIKYEKNKTNVSGDKNMVHFIIRNLILNAIKFSEERTELNISSHNKNGLAHFSIQTRIKKGVVDKIDDLWNSGKQMGESVIKDEKTSLGLLLTKYFVDRNIGKLNITQKNKVTEFNLELRSV